MRKSAYLHIHVGRELHGVVVVESDHLLVDRPGVNIAPPVPPASPPTPASHPLVVLQELPGDPLIVHLDLGDHVAGNVARPPAALAPVETVCVLLSDDLDELAKYFITLKLSTNESAVMYELDQ